ncbi:MAG: methylenetetrahydrofolate reductase [Verrucomicrobiae bacterium]|nr:methylenetetrahydrofolate reductase [Verrucomicrobiae bacterium]
MEFIRDIHARCQREGRPALSFEFFPPKSDEGLKNLFERTLPALLALRPDYASVTYGAGGSTRDKTLGIVDRIQREHGLTAMAHLTCVNSTRDMLRQVLDEARSRGIRNILALRGDPPDGNSSWTPTEGGFEYSWELVRFIRELGGFGIGVAGFPEGHIACQEGKHVDWQRLQHKVGQGADFVITQLFFDNADFFEFQSFLRNQLGSHVTLIPGLLPILSTAQVKKFTTLCGARIPDAMMARLNELGDDDEAVTAYGIDYCAAQCRELLDRGVAGLHFYSLNKARSTVEVARRLGLA